MSIKKKRTSDQYALATTFECDLYIYNFSSFENNTVF